MKKYPVTYKGKRYEVRWTDDFLERVCIYEERKKLGIKYFKETYSEYETTLRQYLKRKDVCKDVNYYVEEVKILFEFWENETRITKDKKRLEYNQLKALKEWDGEIC